MGFFDELSAKVKLGLTKAGEFKETGLSKINNFKDLGKEKFNKIKDYHEMMMNGFKSRYKNFVDVANKYGEKANDIKLYGTQKYEQASSLFSDKKSQVSQITQEYSQKADEIKKNMDKTVLNPRILKERLAKGTRVKMLAVDEHEYEQIMTQLLEQKDTNNYTLNIGGGALFGVISYGIAGDIIKRGIKPNEFVGNSAGAIVASLLATGRMDRKYFDYFLYGIDKGNLVETFQKLPLIASARLIPFFVKVYHQGHAVDIETKFMEHPEILFDKLMSIYSQDVKDEGLSEDVLKYIISNALHDIDGENYSYSSLTIHKVTFDDVEREYGNKLRMFATIVDKPTIKDISIFESVMLGGEYPIIDALKFSTAASAIHKGVINGKECYITDGYYGGKQFASDFRDFEYKDNIKILVETDTTPGLIGVCGLPGFGGVPDYGVNDYVIAPNLGFMSSFNYKNVNKMYEIVAKYTKEEIVKNNQETIDNNI